MNEVTIKKFEGQDIEKMNPEHFLAPTKYINSDHPEVLKKAKELQAISSNKIEYMKHAYEFVRDEIPHSWDIKDTRITKSASDVLAAGTGICWTKSNLLAALLRAYGIPSGLSYQHLALGDTKEAGYCIHALNTAYLLDEKRWIRIDARGNREDIHSEFSLETEKLSFVLRKELGEMDYFDNHPDADPRLMKILEESNTILEVRTCMLPGEF